MTGIKVANYQQAINTKNAELRKAPQYFNSVNSISPPKVDININKL